MRGQGVTINLKMTKDWLSIVTLSEGVFEKSKAGNVRVFPSRREWIEGRFFA
jgi:hypothetical protein